MPRKRGKCVVLLSGGMDSAVSLWWAKKKGWTCYALAFNYGQRHKKELRQARILARLAKTPLNIISFALPWSLSSLTDQKQKLPKRPLSKISTDIPSTYVPGRNALFLSFALSYADQIGARAIAIGANAIDYSGYPDCRGPFLKVFEKMAWQGTKAGHEKKKIRVLAPLLHLNKAQIVRLGRKLGVPLDLTWSCYAGKNAPCGRCDSCLLRAKGFQDALQP
jgi:7-cyano-7-deazaguanine synthase